MQILKDYNQIIDIYILMIINQKIIREYKIQ